MLIRDQARRAAWHATACHADQVDTIKIWDQFPENTVVFFTHVPTSWGHVINLRPNSWKYVSPIKNGTKFLNIFFTHVPTVWSHDRKLGPTSWKYFSPIQNGTKFLKIFFTHKNTDQIPENIFHPCSHYLKACQKFWTRPQTAGRADQVDTLWPQGRPWLLPNSGG